MSNQQGLRYYNDYNQIEECPYYPQPSKNRQIIEDYPSDRGHKRDKKWSFSNLFRRKKKDSFSASSSEEDQKKSGGFLQRKRKSEPRKKTKHIGTFDHVVLPPTQRIVPPKPVIYPDHVTNDSSQKNSADSYESLHSGKRCHSRSSCASTSLDSVGRKSRRELVKARVEARRDCLKTESSSEDDSQRSLSSSVTKFRSDESLIARSRDNSRTRSARTERFVHRRSSKESLNSGNCNSCNGLPLPAKEPPNHYYYSPPPLVSYGKPEPPPPPPRDPQRRLIIGQVGENGRPVSYSFETDQQENPPPRMKNCGSNTSIQSYNSDIGNQKQNQRESTPFRSSSVNSEPIRRYIKRHPRLLSETDPNGSEKYNYFADHLPRSRKPIVIQASNLPENKYLSDSQIVTRNSQLRPSNGLKMVRPTAAPPIPKDAIPKSPPPVDTFRVRVTKEEGGLVSTVAVKNRMSPPKPRTTVPSTPKLTYSKSEEKETPPAPLTLERRSSSNLEDALNELEAIYNSLRLGDEDLLDRAEQQEIQSRLQSKTADTVRKCGSMSDSGFDFDYQDRNRFKRSFLKSSSASKKSDDMAERKLQQQQIPAVAELEKGLTQISYLLASPVHNSIDSFCANPQPDEPDITLDDVVFRSIKHINNTLKVVDPQPPFGIPLGPISAAPNSDYLHAVPEEKQRNTFKPNRIPDVVKDDLAYRSLRKDGSRDPSLPFPAGEATCEYLQAAAGDKPRNKPNVNSEYLQAIASDKQRNKPTAMSNNDYFQAVWNEKLRSKQSRIPDVFKDDMAYRSLRQEGGSVSSLTADDYINNNKNLPFSAKKNRAVRSLSANIYNLLHNTDTLEKAKSITDMAKDAEADKSWMSDGKSKLHKKVQVYVPLYSNSIVNSKPPSGFAKSSSKRATPSPVPRPTEPSEATSSPETVQSHSETAQKQLDAVAVVAEHARLCEKLVECLVESTELISQNKAVTEFVPDDEQLLELEQVPAPSTLPKATVTESAEAQMTTFLEVEPITVEMLSETDDHDGENAENKGLLAEADADMEEEVNAEAADLSESSTVTPVEQICNGACVEDEVQGKGERFARACPSPSAESCAKAEFNRLDLDRSSGGVARLRDAVSSADASGASSCSNGTSGSQSCAWHRDPAPFVSVCYQSACDLFQNVDIIALLGLLLAIVSVIVCFVQ